jgi:hypothetical protein
MSQHKFYMFFKRLKHFKFYICMNLGEKKNFAQCYENVL